MIKLFREFQFAVRQFEPSLSVVNAGQTLRSTYLEDYYNREKRDGTG